MLDWCKKGGSRGYVTTKVVNWCIGKKESGWVLKIMTGREFESSVPAFLQWILSPDDQRFLKAALIHDVLIEGGYRLRFSDQQWLEVTLSEHAPPFKTWMAYRGMQLRRLIFQTIKSIRGKK